MPNTAALNLCTNVTVNVDVSLTATVPQVDDSLDEHSCLLEYVLFLGEDLVQSFGVFDIQMRILIKPTFSRE